MKIRSLRLTLAAGALVAAVAPFGTTGAQAMECQPPAVSTVCWAWGTACQYVPHTGGRLDANSLLCTVVM